jgi:hypothetical protein
MRRFVVTATLGAITAVGFAVPALATPPLPVVGGGGKDSVCLVWRGAEPQGAASAESGAGDLCVGY